MKVKQSHDIMLSYHCLEHYRIFDLYHGWLVLLLIVIGVQNEKTLISFLNIYYIYSIYSVSNPL